MNRVDRIVLDPVRTYACTRTARTGLRVTTCPRGQRISSNRLLLRETKAFRGSSESSEYSDIFSDQLAEKPASLKPLEINIPFELWEIDENRTPVHPQSSTKEVALKENLDEMLASGVIERSDAASYSHPVIVTKSPGKFRTCIDYRPLNRCLKPASISLPTSLRGSVIKNWIFLV